jgi:uncharacterized protein YlxW (UPF0749 family)
MNQPTPTRRPDASMTLLKEVMERPLDPGYAAAARRKARERDQDAVPAQGRRGTALVVTLLLAVLGGALAVVAVAELRVPAAASSRQVLVDEIDARTAHVDSLEQEVGALRSEIDSLNAAALAGRGTALSARAELLGVRTGAVAVTGRGVVIQLDNAQGVGDLAGRDPRDREQAERGRVRDRDLQVVVNGLWDAGADAIAVNGQRLTALSSIREAGAAVLVNFRPLSPPYRVEAIGNPQKMQVDFASSAAGRYLASLQQNYGVRASVAGADRLQLPAASGLRLRYAHPPQPTTPTAPAQSRGSQSSSTNSEETP